MEKNRNFSQAINFLPTGLRIYTPFGRVSRWALGFVFFHVDKQVSCEKILLNLTYNCQNFQISPTLIATFKYNGNFSAGTSPFEIRINRLGGKNTTQNIQNIRSAV